jgi:hypothetical protein
VTLDRDYLDDRAFPPREGAGVLVVSAPDERGLSALLARLHERLFHDGEVRIPLPLEHRKLYARPDWVPEGERRP